MAGLDVMAGILVQAAKLVTPQFGHVHKSVPGLRLVVAIGRPACQKAAQEKHTMACSGEV